MVVMSISTDSCNWHTLFLHERHFHSNPVGNIPRDRMRQHTFVFAVIMNCCWNILLNIDVFKSVNFVTVVRQDATAHVCICRDNELLLEYTFKHLRF